MRRSKLKPTSKVPSKSVPAPQKTKTPAEIIQAWAKKESAAEQSGKGLEEFRRRATVAGLPRLSLEYMTWIGKDTFPIADKSNSSSTNRKGMNVTFDPPMLGIVMPPLEPSIEQIRAYNHLKAHFPQLLKLAERAVKKLEPRIAAYTDDDLEEGNRQNRRRWIRPGSVFVINMAKNGVAYSGIGFRCSWDPEHGFYLGLHKSRVISCDDVTSLPHDAKRDGGRDIKVKLHTKPD